jgi:hypothetical protein
MAVRTKAGVLSRLREHQDEIKSLGVRRLGLFGSFVRRQQNAESDIDLLVEFEPDKKTFDNFMALAFLLDEILGRRVELVTPESLSPFIGAHIMEEAEYVSVGH